MTFHILKSVSDQQTGHASFLSNILKKILRKIIGDNFNILSCQGFSQAVTQHCRNRELRAEMTGIQ